MIWRDLSHPAVDHSITLSVASQDRKGNPLTHSSFKAFNIEGYQKDNKYSCSSVDAVHVAMDKSLSPGRVLLIEFKRGDVEDWNDHDEDTFYKKAFDTIHVLLRDIIKDADEWRLMFSDSCSIEYLICLDDDNSLFDTDPDPLHRLHNRQNVQKSRRSVGINDLSKALVPCSKRHPFASIDIIPSYWLATYLHG